MTLLVCIYKIAYPELERYMRLTKIFVISVLPILFCSINVQAFNLNELNYGFASYLGTGIYSVSDRDVQIYQIPFSYTFDHSEDNKWQLKLRAPVTLGFYDFTYSDIPDTGLPDKASTFSFVPGVEALYPIKNNWLFGPFLDAGLAINLETDDTNNIYGAGIASIYKHIIKQKTLTIANRFLYARDEGSNIDLAEDFSSFETVLDLRFPSTQTEREYVYDFSLYYANYRYFDNLDFLRPSKRPVEVVIQNEIGFTFGLKHAVKWKYLSIPRIGIGYRFGDELSIFRIIIGSVF